MEDHINRVLTKMDSDEEKLRYLGFLGIFKESFKIIFSRKKIFTLITVFFILPLSIIFLVEVHLSSYPEHKIHWERDDINRSRFTDRYHHVLTRDRLDYRLIEIALSVFVLMLSLLSTSAVVYAVACNYTGKPITFKNVMSVVPKVWKRVVITFIWSFFINLAYAICMVVTIVLWVKVSRYSPFALTIGFILFILFFIGFVYLSIIWQLASVVSVLEEETYGIKAMIKSKNLIQGKRRVTGFIFLLLVSFYCVIMALYLSFLGELPKFAFELIIGIPCLVLLTFLFLFSLVIQTVIYFVCKSYHWESIDEPALADHLEPYFKSEPQKQATKDVQPEQVHVAAKYTLQIYV